MTDRVFIDVDTQVDFMDPKGNLYVAEAETLVANLKKLVAFARRNGIPIIASMDTHVPDDPEFEVFPPHCVRDTAGHSKIEETTVPGAKWVAIDGDPIVPAPGEEVLIEKHIYSLFDNPNAERILKELSPAQCVVFGVATDYCVKHAVLGLCERGWNTTVVTDAIKPVNPDDEADVLAEFRDAGARFATTAEILARDA